MRFSRREFGRLTLAGVPGVALATRSGGLLDALAQSKPNSLINGVQIGTITYSYRSMPDQSAEATLKYIVDSGISAIELMGGPVESFAGAPAAAGRRWWWRAPGGAAAAPGGAAGCAAAVPLRLLPVNLAPRRSDRGMVSPARPDVAAARRAAAVAGAAAASRRAEQQAAQQEQAAKLKAWRTSRVDGSVQEAAQDVQRRRRDDLRLEAAQPEHVGRGVRVHLQRRRGARLHPHDAGVADRRRGS